MGVPLKLLDLFCGAGGSAVGYHRAGFDVVGVDIAPQPHYPYEFMQYDALAYLAELRSDGWLALMQWDAIHASPPCQAYSALATVYRGRWHPDLLPRTRAALKETGLPYVIENVVGAPVRASVMLCGGGWLPVVMCDDGKPRQVRRHRYFETNWPLMGHPCHHPYEALGVYGGGRFDNADSPDRGGYKGTKRERAEGLGIEWMSFDELANAIPPVYTEYIGRHLYAVAAGGRRVA